MLNSQHRIAPQKNIANAQDPTQIFFCVAAVPKDSQRFLKAVCKHDIFLCPLTTFSQGQSLRQHGKRTATKMA
jgi:uncharacterized membrane protein YbaN (DUF454 family)